MILFRLQEHPQVSVTLGCLLQSQQKVVRPSLEQPPFQDAASSRQRFCPPPGQQFEFVSRINMLDWGRWVVS